MDSRLFSACKEGDDTALEALIEAERMILYRAVTSCNETPLHVAVLCGHLTTVRVLLRHKRVLVSERDQFGSLPLHYAAAEGSVEIVSELLRENGGLCREPGQFGRTPLHLAVMKGHKEVVRELIRFCPDCAFDRLDRGETVFHLSIKHHRLEVLETLVDLLGEDQRQLLLAVDGEGNTVLHSAAFFKQIQTVTYLKTLEAVRRIAANTNGNGHTARDMVERSSTDFTSLQILEALIQVGVPRGNIVAAQNPNPANTNPTDPQSPIKKLRDSVLDYLTVKHDADWLANAHGSMMVVATLVASIAFQAGVNPPGGVWQEDMTDSRNCTKLQICKAGTAVLKDEKEFHDFYMRNSWVLVVAVFVILTQFGVFSIKNKIGTWLLTLVMCLMLHNILAAYDHATKMVVSPKLLPQVHKFWKPMIGIIIVLQSARMLTWFMFDRATSFWRKENKTSYSWVTNLGIFSVTFIVVGGLVGLVIKF